MFTQLCFYLPACTSLCIALQPHPNFYRFWSYVAWLVMCCKTLTRVISMIYCILKDCLNWVLFAEPWSTLYYFTIWYDTFLQHAADSLLLKSEDNDVIRGGRYTIVWSSIETQFQHHSHSSNPSLLMWVFRQQDPPLVPLLGALGRLHWQLH